MSEDEVALRDSFRKFFEAEVPVSLRQNLDQVLVFTSLSHTGPEPSLQDLKPFLKNQCKFEKPFTGEDFPNHREFMKKCGDMGILGLLAAEKYGGTKMGIFASSLAVEEAARLSSIFSFISSIFYLEKIAIV